MFVGISDLNALTHTNIVYALSPSGAYQMTDHIWLASGYLRLQLYSICTLFHPINMAYNMAKRISLWVSFAC